MHYDLCGVSYRSSGTEDGGDAGFVEEVVILCGDDTTDSDHDVRATEFLEFLDDLRDEGLVTGCQRGDTQHMDIILHGLFGCLSSDVAIHD